MIGRSVRRKEDQRFLSGTSCFIADIQRAGMVYAAVCRSPHAHARICSLDASAARGRPGVLAVFTFANLGADASPIPVRLGPHPDLNRCLQYPLAGERVRYVGEPIALVVAENPYLAEDALDGVQVEFAPLPAFTDVRQPVAPGAEPIHGQVPDNVVHSFTVAMGDVDAAFARADHVVRARFATQRHAGVPLETRGLVAEYDRGTGLLTVWGPTKVPHFNRAILARMLRMPEGRIRFIEVDVGGGFGVRGEFYPEDLLIPLAAMRLGRPVKWIEDRLEHLKAANHSREQVHEAEMALAADGTILGLRDTFTADMGAYVRTHGNTVPDHTAAILPGPYRLAHYQCTGRAVLTNKTPIGTYRSPGRYEANFVRERLLDLASAQLGIDPAELRRRNLVRPEDMPYETGLETLKNPIIFDQADWPAMFERALAEAGYREFRDRQEQLRRQGRYVGLGLGCFVEKSGYGPYETARVQLDGSGKVMLYTGSSMLGQGLETTLAQICAASLTCSLADITVIHGDTALVPVGVGTFASRSTVCGGNAVHLAAQRLRTKILEVGAGLLEAGVADVVLEDGAVRPRGAPGRAVTLPDIAAAVTEQSRRPGAPEEVEPLLEAAGKYVPPRMGYSFGVHVAQVEVDPATFAVAVQRYIIVYDSGRMVNPAIVEGQLHGALAQGLGGALMEELSYSPDGQLLAGTFMDYLLPTATDVPRANTVVFEFPSPLNPLGLKGVGEAGIAVTGGAVANAVADALRPFGVDARSLPLTPEKLFRAVQAGQAGSGGAGGHGQSDGRQQR